MTTLPHIPTSAIATLRDWAACQPAIWRVYLFGSRIRGMTKEGGPVRPDSDLDMAVELMPEIVDTFGAWMERVETWREQLALLSPFKVQLEALDAETPNVRRYVEEGGLLIFDRMG